MLFDAATGALSDNTPPGVARASRARGRATSSSIRRLPFVYLLNELDATVDALALRRRGRHAARGRGRTGAAARIHRRRAVAADLHLTPDGRFLFASERRSSTLAVFAVDAARGALTPVATIATEREPRGFAISPDGRFLLAVGQASHRLSRYAIDGASGALSKLGDQPIGTNPNWVEIVDLPR